MKHSVLGKAGRLLLITGIAFAAPVYAETHTGSGAMSMGEKGESGAQQMSGLMNDISSEVKNMSSRMSSSNPALLTRQNVSIHLMQ